MEVSKAAWQSKTIWVNLISALVGVLAIWVPEVKEKITPELLLTAFAFVNMLLRLVTKKPIEFK